MTKGKFTRIEQRFLRSGSIQIKKNIPKSVTQNENNEVNVLAYFEVHPRHSIPGASRDLGISSSSVYRILKSHKMHPYSETLVQGFQDGDELRRVEFCESFLIKTQEDEQFLSKIIWTDESKFSREGIVNKRNNHHWARKNPHIYREGRFQHTFSFNVFCLLMDDTVMYEIYNENLNGQRYQEILRGSVSNFLNALPQNRRRECWYQLDGAPAHSSAAVYQELNQMFDDHWIGPNGPCRWPPRSPDLTPLDFYLWGRIKDEVYVRPVQTREELLNRVRTAFRNLDGHEIRKSTNRGVRRRVLRCLARNGGHIEHDW